MATINGGRWLRMDDKVCSVKLGKQADLIAIDMIELETAPTFDVISHIVYAAGRENVSHTWVNGRCLLNNRQLTTLDADELKHKAGQWRARIAG